MRKILVSLAAGAAMVASTGAATADGYGYGSVKDAAAPVEQVNWNGLYIGAAIGYGVATTDVEKSVQFKDHKGWSPKYSILDLDGLSSEGALGTLTLGYDREVIPGLLIGVFGDYTFGDLDNDFSAFEGLAKVNSELGDSWSVGARIGLITHKTLWYAMAGYTQADLDWEVHALGEKIASGGETLDGYFVGLGVEHQLFHNLSLKLDYRYSDYDGLDQSNELYCTKFNLDTDTDVHAVRLGVNWKVDLFGGHHVAAAPAYEPLK